MTPEQHVYRDPSQPPRRVDYGECYARSSGVPCPLSDAGALCLRCRAYREAWDRWNQKQAAASEGAMWE